MPKPKKSKINKQQPSILAFANQTSTLQLQNNVQPDPKATKKLIDKVVKLRQQISRKKMQQISALNKLMRMCAIDDPQFSTIIPNSDKFSFKQNFGSQALYRIDSILITESSLEPQEIYYPATLELTQETVIDDWFGIVLGTRTSQKLDIESTKQDWGNTRSYSELIQLTIPQKYLESYNQSFPKILRTIEKSYEVQDHV